MKFEIRNIIGRRINVCSRQLISAEDKITVTEKSNEIKNLEKQGYISVTKIKEESTNERKN